MAQDAGQGKCTQCDAVLKGGQLGFCEVCQNRGTQDPPRPHIPARSLLSDQDYVASLLGKVLVSSMYFGLMIVLVRLWMHQQFGLFIGMTIVLVPAALYALCRFVEDWIRSSPRRSLFHYGSIFMNVFAVTSLICLCLFIFGPIVLLSLLFIIGMD